MLVATNEHQGRAIMAGKRSPEFGSLVRKILDEKGLSFRGAWKITGVHYTTVSTMADGVIPKTTTIKAFAEGLGVDAQPLLDEARKAMFPESELQDDQLVILLRSRLPNTSPEVLANVQEVVKQEVSKRRANKGGGTR